MAGIGAGVLILGLVLLVLQGVINLGNTGGAIQSLAEKIAPDGSDYSAPMHLAAAFVFLMLVIQYFILGRLNPDKWFTGPAVGLCLLMGLAASIYGMIHANGGNPILILVVAAILLVIGGMPRYKIRLPGFCGRYECDNPIEIYPIVPIVRHPAKGEDGTPSDCPETGHVLWRPTAHLQGQKYPLILACVSGGGIRASVWTASVLAPPDVLERFQNVRADAVDGIDCCVLTQLQKGCQTTKVE